eukprot:TRINITY_DN11689_c0_g1_i1.p1 TRINITY_DN11689_c0_g1~~TRINITY_DN11689_c0_g1_i1.p1  ORF type:complete len:229 (+),score=14.94 TRINITY_DN11689_c0_g1_i1:56-742(+)
MPSCPQCRQESRTGQRAFETLPECRICSGEAFQSYVVLPCGHCLCNACSEAVGFVVIQNGLELRRGNVQDGDLIFIKLANRDIWLAEQPNDTYCAVAGGEDVRAVFRVEFVQFEGRGSFRLVYHGRHPYLLDNNCLYAATTGSTKYDRRSNNTKQLWVLDHGGDVSLNYNTPVRFLDRYVFSYMAVNLASSAQNYSNGNGKYWVEAKYDRHMIGGFDNLFMILPAMET